MKRTWWKMGIAIVSLGLLLTACKGEKAAKEVTEDDVKQAQAFVEKAHELASQGAAKAEEAVQAYKKAIALNPQYAEAYNGLGLVQR